jgi:hypothetical protein
MIKRSYMPVYSYSYDLCLAIKSAMSLRDYPMFLFSLRLVRVSTHNLSGAAVLVLMGRIGKYSLSYLSEGIKEHAGIRSKVVSISQTMVNRKVWAGIRSAGRNDNHHPRRPVRK